MPELTAQTVLVVEDEELMRAILRQLIEDAGYNVVSADSAESAIEAFTSNDVAVTLTDIKMSGKDGLQLLDQIKIIDNEAVVIIMTAFSSVDTAVAALRKGAYDYVTKPFVNDDLLQTIKNAAKLGKLFQENRVLRRELRRHYGFSEIVGKSEQMMRIFDIIRKVADTNASILIQGESGTGKELVARSIHLNSQRADNAFLAINCGALPESLLESELFGHKKGSFTGAVANRDGLIRSVDGGTLFLDEIGEMPFALQVKLLRALQEHEVTPVGATRPVPFDARILAATNKDLANEVENGTFREDLYYRLNVVEIAIPPLRYRREDIPLLIQHFVAKHRRGSGVPISGLSKPVMDALCGYDWPGNIRELENTIERATILGGNEIRLEDLPAKLLANTRNTDSSSFGPTLDEVEKKYVLEVLTAFGEDKNATARILGIDLSTLYRKLKKFNEE
ncbi:MAG TPA: sigma-54 dependent transcriptional regulator [Pyrinomonadaceae bacterium]|nr:sigma-54-dependent Fis family transcriptional regulator [Pyrinomonadaceae bacterium]HQY68314.1 sigma-54 dependent transcriptional regulator [Pyrinomonadaceae bacterium]HRA39688.1 sigma-54 dependent transcriptional regulator [Pyrinomonadaceae bacterium]